MRSRNGSSRGTSEIASVHNLGALAGARQTAALDPGQILRTVLTSPIGAPERSKARVHLLLLGEADTIDRRDPVGGAAAGQQHQQDRLRSPRGQLQTVVGALEARLVGHRMSASITLMPPGRNAMPCRVVAMP